VAIYLIALLVIIALLIVIIIPIVYVDNQEYGKYVVTSDRCVANGAYCADGGTRTIIQDCIPNPITNQPCLHNGKLTFDSIITTQPCNVQCYSARWTKIDTMCEGSNLVDVYECQSHDPSGVNDCGEMATIPYTDGFIKQYVIRGLGATKTKLNFTDSNICGSIIPQGNWVSVGPKGTIEQTVTDRYHLSKSCEADYHLQEGVYRVKPACSIDGNINLDGSGCDLTTKPAEQFQPCRKYIVPNKINNIIDKLYGSYLTIRMNGKYLGILENDVSQPELVFQDNPTPFFLAPRQILSDKANYQFTAIIACLPSLGRNGWIINNVQMDNILHWVPASDGPDLPGMTSDQATIFNILIVRDKFLTIKGTNIINAEITLYPIDTIGSFYS
jgi:hypothetical protein